MTQKQQKHDDWIILPGTTIGGEVGTFRVDFTIRNRNTGQSRELNGLVDTGASYTIIPAGILDELGIEHDETELFSLADGSVQELDIGWADMVLEGRTRDPFTWSLVPAARKSCWEPWPSRHSLWPPTPKTTA